MILLLINIKSSNYRTHMPSFKTSGWANSELLHFKSWSVNSGLHFVNYSISNIFGATNRDHSHGNLTPLPHFQKKTPTWHWSKIQKKSKYARNPLSPSWLTPYVNNPIIWTKKCGRIVSPNKSFHFAKVSRDLDDPHDSMFWEVFWFSPAYALKSLK